ncbi:hypothetical protein [Pseudonocardia lacus]|uniref:hypothetical protein n=1 Tax=Pseudonocardia lacus TaxID=2835865 RepID=UPI001BDC6D74|nr:hypothetical protein [Pseudonocardia lacus]
MSLTTNALTTSVKGAGLADDPEKGFGDFLSGLGGILPGVAQTLAPTVGIDPRIAGQTVSQVLSIFGIGKGKAFVPAVPKEQAVAQLREIVSPHLNDPAFMTALQAWTKAAVEPVAALQQGKAFQPSVDMTKNWFTDAIDSIGDAVSSVDWGRVAQVGMQVLPVVLAAL